MMQCGRFSFSGDQPLIMGVINVTPDSFSDGGLHFDSARAIEHGFRLAEEGADILDIGGESTRPGAQSLSIEAEQDRVMPVIEALRDCGAALSIDTRKPELMRIALARGADMVNDVEGFRNQDAIAAVAASPTCAVCVMHMLGTPESMQSDPRYADVVGEVSGWLGARVAALRDAGVDPSRVLVDPGIGFGKRIEHNLALIAGIDRLRLLAPVLIGVSRKSMIGMITGRPVGERLAGGLAAMLAAVARGARVVRVHDVAETRDALRVWRAIQEAEDSPGGACR
jgi:dihydropteroate synthase